MKGSIAQRNADARVASLTGRAETCARRANEHLERGERSDATRLARRARTLLTLAHYARTLQAVAAYQS